MKSLPCQFQIYNNWYQKPKIASFLSKYSFSSVDETVISLQMYESYHLLGTYLYTAATETTLFNYIQPEKAIAAMDIEGPFGPIHINTNGQRLAGEERLQNPVLTLLELVSPLGGRFYYVESNPNVSLRDTLLGRLQNPFWNLTSRSLSE